MVTLRRHDHNPILKSKKINLVHCPALSIEERNILLTRIEKELCPIISETNQSKFVVVFGLNVVTRLLERRLLSVVVLSKDSNSGPIIQHILILAQLYKVPVCILPEASGKLGNLFGLRSVIAFGIRKWDSDIEISDDMRENLASIQDFIISKCILPKTQVMDNPQ